MNTARKKEAQPTAAVDHRDDAASDVNDAEDPGRRIRERHDRCEPEDLPHVLGRNRVFLAGQPTDDELSAIGALGKLRVGVRSRSHAWTTHACERAGCGLYRQFKIPA